MKKNYTLLFFLLSISQIVFSQVPQKVIVEHFTNSRCGLCANRNPGFYTNLANHPGVLHLAFHPSSPYSSCIFSQHNPSENDDRTNYYGIYGSTPKLVIQGNTIPAGTNYGNSGIFEPYVDQMSPISIELRQFKNENGMIEVEVSATVEVEHTLGSLSLFVALAEDSVFYDAPNSEDLHQDVFRLALSPALGLEFDLPNIVGTSSILTFTSTAHPDWDFSRIYAIAMVQETDSKDIIQAEATNPSDQNLISSINEIEKFSLNVWPNPVSNIINIQTDQETSLSGELFNTSGKLILQKEIFQNGTLNISHLPKGIYFLKINNEKEEVVKKIVKL